MNWLRRFRSNAAREKSTSAKSLEKLLSIASPPLFNGDSNLGSSLLSGAGSLSTELSDLLSRRNGFFAFESALRLFPSASSPLSLGLTEWNDTSLWAFEYGKLSQECFFFAEDIFGGQFCVHNGAIEIFDPETGLRKQMAETLAEWAEKILADYEVLTGYPLAHEWQQANGGLTGRQRLVPKIPFVAGGEYHIANLRAVESAQGMRSRGRFARAIEKLPDGAQILFDFDENE
jgi:hypothetical protein